MITMDTPVEEIVKLPNMIYYLIKRGVSPITCDGPFPQSIGRLLEVKKVAHPENFIANINTFLEQQERQNPGNENQPE